MKRKLNFDEKNDDNEVSLDQSLITKKIKLEMINENLNSIPSFENFAMSPEEDKENSFDMNNNSNIEIQDLEEEAKVETKKLHGNTPIFLKKVQCLLHDFENCLIIFIFFNRN